MLAANTPSLSRALAVPVLPLSSSSRPNVRLNAVKDRDMRQENVPGSFAVDKTCIDCDTCRWMQPEVFGRVNGQSAVVKQPATEQERLRAAQALLSCPTHSIHLMDAEKDVVKRAAKALPALFPGTDNVYHTGFHSIKTNGAASYLITRPEGNVLVDGPRFDSQLVENIKALGGAKYLFLSHRDDVADHAQWAEALSALRIIHKSEVTEEQGTTDCEIQLEGEGPWLLPDGGKDVELVHTPGHTPGHIVVLHHASGTLFTADHCGFGYDGQLDAFKLWNKDSWEQQLDSIEKLQDLPFYRLLPGHGRPGSFQSDAERAAVIQGLLKRERSGVTA